MLHDTKIGLISECFSSFQTGEFSKENRIKLEKYWKEKIKHKDSATQDVSVTHNFSRCSIEYYRGHSFCGNF